MSHFLGPSHSLSIGIAETKTLARIVNHLAKKSYKAKGILDLAASPFHDHMLEHTPVSEVWGVGKQITKKLQAEGIKNARQLRDADLSWIRSRFTVVVARQSQVSNQIFHAHNKIG